MSTEYNERYEETCSNLNIGAKAQETCGAGVLQLGQLEQFALVEWDNIQYLLRGAQVSLSHRNRLIAVIKRLYNKILRVPSFLSRTIS